MTLIRRTPPARIARNLHPAWGEGGWALASSLLVILVAWFAMGFSGHAFHVPAAYSTETSVTQYLAASHREDGWFGTVSRAAAPFETAVSALPNADGFSLLLMRALAIFSDDPFVLLNLYLLAGFALCASIGYAVYRRLGLASPWAAAATLAFALLPMHFLRVQQPFLTMYFSAALVGWLALEVVSENPLDRSKPWARRALVVFACVICGMCGMSYAMFGGLIIAAAGICTALDSRSAKPLRRAVLIISIIIAAVAVNLAPSGWSTLHGGSDSQSIAQVANTPESLSLTSMLLPRPDHLVSGLNELRAKYNGSMSPTSDVGDSALGLIGAVGLVLLLMTPFLGRWSDRVPSVVRQASGPTYAGVLFSTLGGLGVFLATLFFTEANTLARIVPFVAFFAILASLRLLQAFFERRQDTHPRTTPYVVALLLAGLCIVDQAGAGRGVKMQEQAAAFERDQRFFAAVENAVPAHSMILQLPLSPYPTSTLQPLPAAFDPYAGYLHTKTLRWSSGAIRGRIEERWQTLFDAFPLQEKMTALAALGFAGIVIDKHGYADPASTIDVALAQAKLQPTLQNEDATRVYYAVPGSKALRYRAYAVAPLDGWSVVETLAADVWMWSTGSASLELANAGGTPRSCYIDLELQSFAVDRKVILRERGKTFAEQSLKAGVSTRFSAYLDAVDGPRTIELVTDVPPVSPGESDSRLLAFRMNMRTPPLCL